MPNVFFDIATQRQFREVYEAVIIVKWSVIDLII